MHWLAALGRLRDEREAGVLVTVADVRGHAPRDAGAKMVVAAGRSWGSVGGGNLEETAISRARAMLETYAVAPEQLVLNLSDKARTDHGRQCCGGEVTLLLVPLPVAPSVAVFGVGHVGLELARILGRHDLDLHLVDSRADQLSDERLAVLADGEARVRVHHSPVPELALGRAQEGDFAVRALRGAFLAGEGPTEGEAWLPAYVFPLEALPTLVRQGSSGLPRTYVLTRPEPAVTVEGTG